MSYIDKLEKIRKDYQPEKIRVLFVGESIPSNNSFFYMEDSPLYKYTKEAFEEVFKGTEFSLDFFKEKGCFLFDLTESVSGMTHKQRVDAIANGIPKLAKLIAESKPDYIISTKGSNINAIVMANAEVDDLVPQENIFDLPAPIFGSHHYYRDRLVQTLNAIYLNK
jgi:hypothetical protein